MSKKLISSGVLYFLLVMVVVPFYPGRAKAEEPLSISGLAIETKSFRPYREKGKFSFFLNRASQITAEIQDSDFNLIRNLALMKPGVSGENELKWDGKDENGKFIDDGKYIFSLSAITDDGSSALISKEMAFDFDASEGTEFKNRISKIEGKKKKTYYSSTNPPGKTVWGEFIDVQGATSKDAYIYGKEREGHACWGVYLTTIVTIISAPFLCLYSFFRSTPAFEKIAEKNKEIEEHNAKIDAEVAGKNKDIDEFNERVKDTVTITMELVD